MKLFERLMQLNFKKVRTRSLFDLRMVHAHREHEKLSIQVEVADSLEDGYTRLTFVFKDSLEQGIQILWEDRLGFRWFLRGAKIDLEDEEVSEAFITLARDSERLDLLLTPELKRVLMELESGAADVQLTDEALYILYEKALLADELDKRLTQGVRLCKLLLSFVKEHGPINDFRKDLYTASSSAYVRADDDGQEFISHNLPDPTDGREALEEHEDHLQVAPMVSSAVSSAASSRVSFTEERVIEES